MKSVLVTGYSGQLGRAFAEVLAANNWEGQVATQGRDELDKLVHLCLPLQFV